MAIAQGQDMTKNVSARYRLKGFVKSVKSGSINVTNIAMRKTIGV